MISLMKYLLAAGFYVFVTFAFPYLPFHPEQTWGISYYHKINAFLIVGGCLGIFARAMYSGECSILFQGPNVSDFERPQIPAS